MKCAVAIASLLLATQSGAESVCTADLLCVAIQRTVPIGPDDHRVTLTLNNLSTKPLSFRLLLPQGLDHNAHTGVIQLDSPRQQTLATFTRPSTAWGFEYRVHYGHTSHTHNDKWIYALPYAPGKSYVVSQSNNNLSTHHVGNRFALDWTMPVGEPIHAARGGRVVSTYARSNSQSTTGKASANHIWLQHDDGTIGKYLHLAFQGVLVSEGEQVATGQHIGVSGNTGFTHGPHLHFSVSSLAGESLYETFKLRFHTQVGAQSLTAGERYRHPDP